MNHHLEDMELETGTKTTNSNYDMNITLFVFVVFYIYLYVFYFHFLLPLNECIVIRKPGKLEFFPMVKICTYNARGLGDFNKRKQLFTLIKHKIIDVTLIQESHANNDLMYLWRSQWGGNVLYSNGSTASRGVLILIKRGLEYEILNEIKDEHGRYIITEIEIEDFSFVLCNVYAPNQDTPNFFKEVKAQINGLENRNVIIGEDFNFVINNQLDRLFSHSNNDKARDEFLSLSEDYELVDCWRQLNPERRQYSCCRPNSDENDWQKFSRLGMIFVSAGLFNSVTNSKMQTGFQSDHSFVTININLTECKRGPGYWKFNTSHLRDKQFLEAMNALIDEKLIENQPAIMKWEMIKGVLVQFSKQYAKDKAVFQQTKLTEIEQNLDRLKALVEEIAFADQQMHERYINLKK